MAIIKIENKRYDFPAFYIGESFKARNITFTKKDGTAPDSNLSEVHMLIYDEKGTLIVDLENPTNITIVDAVNWIIRILKFDITWPKGKYKYLIYTINAATETEYPQFGVIDVKAKND